MTVQEATLAELAMLIEDHGLTAVVAPLRRDPAAVVVLADGVCDALRAALTDPATSDVAWLRAYVAARIAPALPTGLRPAA